MLAHQTLLGVSTHIVDVVRVVSSVTQSIERVTYLMLSLAEYQGTDRFGRLTNDEEAFIPPKNFKNIRFNN